MSFYSRFLELCNELGISPSAAAEEAGLRKSSVTAWKNGSSPSDATKLKLATYFRVSPDYFDRKSDIPTLRLPSANDPRPPLRVPPLRLPTADKSEDAEIAAYLQQIKDDPSTRIMFDLAKGATMEEIKATVAFLKALREQR